MKTLEFCDALVWKSSKYNWEYKKSNWNIWIFDFLLIFWCNFLFTGK